MIRPSTTGFAKPAQDLIYEISSPERNDERQPGVQSKGDSQGSNCSTQTKL